MPDDATRTVRLEEPCPTCDGIGFRCGDCFNGWTRRTVTVPADTEVPGDA